MEKTEFVSGLYAYNPHEKAPDFIKASLSVRRTQFIEWLNSKSDEFVKIDILESKDKTKWYASLNTYKKPTSPYSVPNQTPIPPYKEEVEVKVDLDNIF